MRWYDQLFSDPRWRKSALLSLLVALAAAVLATVIGTLAALGISRLGRAARRLFKLLFLSPMVVPLMVIGAGFYVTFAKVGLLGSVASLILRPYDARHPLCHPAGRSAARRAQPFARARRRRMRRRPVADDPADNPAAALGGIGGGLRLRLRLLLRRGGGRAIPLRPNAGDPPAPHVGRHRGRRSRQDDHGRELRSRLLLQSPPWGSSRFGDAARSACA